MQAMLPMGKAGQDSTGNCDRLANEDGKKSRSQPHSSTEGEADREYDSLNSKAHPTHSDSGSAVDSCHPTIARPRAQTGGDVESRCNAHQDDSHKGECQPGKKLVLLWKKINSHL